jgi:hypothetical protein
LGINWSQLGGESFSDQDAVILKKILQGNYVPDGDDPQSFFNEINFNENNYDDDEDAMDTQVMAKQAKPIPWYIIRFDSRFRVYWDLFIIFLAVYNCILIPIDVGFGEKFYGDKKTLVDIIDGSLDVFFLMDFIFNFFTTFVSPKTGTQVTDSKKIATHYLMSTSCYVDLLATIPLDRIAAVFVKGVNLSFFGVLKLVRLLRLRRIVTFLKVNAGN